MAESLVDSYSEANKNNYECMFYAYSPSGHAFGQSFTGNGFALTSCKFYLNKINSPNGSFVAKLYAHSGTFGVNSIPTGSPLATSNPVDSTAFVSNPSFGLVIFTFATPYTLGVGIYYVIVVEKISGFDNGSNWNLLGDHLGAPPNGVGNESAYNGTSWVGSGSSSLCFYVYGTPLPATLAGNISAGASLSGDLKGTVLIAGNIIASASLAADLRGDVSIAGDVSAGASLFGDLNITITNAILESLEKYFAKFLNKGIKFTTEPSIQIKEVIPPAINSTETIRDRIDKYYAFSNG